MIPDVLHAVSSTGVIFRAINLKSAVKDYCDRIMQ